MRLTDEINNDASNYRNRITLIKHYGYRGYNYMSFRFADYKSYDHNY